MLAFVELVLFKIIYLFAYLFLKEMVWQIVNKIDIENAKTTPLRQRSPFIELKGHFTQEFVEEFEASAEGKVGDNWII